VAREFGITGDKVRTVLHRNTTNGPWISNSLETLSKGFILGIDEKH